MAPRARAPRPGEPKYYVSDLGRIAALGWAPRHTDPAAILSELVAVARQNRAGTRNADL